MPPRRCLGCGRLAPGSRCPSCAAGVKALRNAEAPAARAVVSAARAAGALCTICRKPERPGDPFQAGHLDRPLIKGGAGGPLGPQHRSCNSRQKAAH